MCPSHSVLGSMINFIGYGLAQLACSIGRPYYSEGWVDPGNWLGGAMKQIDLVTDWTDGRTALAYDFKPNAIHEVPSEHMMIPDQSIKTKALPLFHLLGWLRPCGSYLPTMTNVAGRERHLWARTAWCCAATGQASCAHPLLPAILCFVLWQRWHQPVLGCANPGWLLSHWILRIK